MKKLKIKISHFNRYLILLIVSLFACIFYLSIPTLYDYGRLQKELETKLFEEYKINISLSNNIRYKILPSPRFEILDSSLYTKDKDNIEEFGKIKKLKINISARSLYKQEKIKIKNIALYDSIFNFNENSWKFISNYFQNENLKKKILIKKSKIFLKKNIVSGALAIFNIQKFKAFFYEKQNQNKINIIGTAFNSPFILKWENDFNTPGKTEFFIKFKEMNLASKNYLQKNIYKENAFYNGNQITNFIGSEIKLNYKFDQKKIDFSSENSIVNNEPILISGNININPFFFNIDFNLNKMNFFKIFNQKSIINELMNNNIFLHSNLNGNLNVEVNKLTKNKVFDFAKLKINFKHGKVSFDTTKLISKKIGIFELLDSKLVEINGNTQIRTSVNLNITDSEKFYQRFQISKKLRKPIDKIFFEIDKDLNSNDLKIYKLEFYKNNKKYPNDGVNIYLNNINYEMSVNSIYDINKFLKEIFKQLN